jgi:hypothetical protein
MNVCYLTNVGADVQLLTRRCAACGEVFHVILNEWAHVPRECYDCATDHADHAWRHFGQLR